MYPFKPSAQYICQVQSACILDAPDIKYLLSKFKHASITIGLYKHCSSWNKPISDETGCPTILWPTVNITQVSENKYIVPITCFSTAIAGNTGLLRLLSTDFMAFWFG